MSSDNIKISIEHPCESGERCVYQNKHRDKACPTDRVDNLERGQEICFFGTVFSCVAKQPCACKKNGYCQENRGCSCSRLIQIEGLEK